MTIIQLMVMDVLQVVQFKMILPAPIRPMLHLSAPLTNLVLALFAQLKVRKRTSSL